MKKKIFGSLAVLAIAVMATFNVNVNTQDNGLSNVSLDNVEALAQEINMNKYSRMSIDCFDRWGSRKGSKFECYAGGYLSSCESSGCS